MNIEKIVHERVASDPLKSVRWALGDPYFEIDDVLLYVGRCEHFMKRLPRSIVDLAITSPPYNIGKAYESDMTLEAYIDWCGSWCRQVYELCVPNGAFWLNLGYIAVPGRGHAVPIPYLLWPKLPFFLKQEIVWNYGAGVAGRLMFSPRNEKWLWLLKSPDSYTFNLDDVRDPNVKYPNQKKNGKIRVNPLGKNPSDVWQIPKVTTGQGVDGQRASPERTKHPAQFPEAVITRIVLASSNPNELILDPFAGSGTTGVVALRLRRKCVLFEADEDYATMARRRLEASVMKPLLFQG